jgi:O-antigen ligase
MGVSLLWCINTKSVKQYLLYYVMFCSLYISNLSLKIYDKILAATRWLITVVAASIILEVFVNDYVYKYCWFFFENSKGRAYYLQEYVLGELYIGAYSGIAGEKSDAAFLMLVGISIILPQIFVNRDYSIVNILNCALYYAALLLTGKRTLFIVSIIILLLSIANLGENISRKIQKYIVVAIIGCVALYVAVIVMPETGTLFDRLTKNLSEDYALAQRIKMWGYAFSMFRNSPILGQGFACYRTYAVYYGWSTAYFAHNIYIEILAELGLVGTFLFAMFIFSILSNINKVRKSFLTNEERIFYSISSNIIMMFLIYGTTGNVLYYTFEITWFIIAAHIIKLVAEKLRTLEENDA